jgi:hypothetical protein
MLAGLVLLTVGSPFSTFLNVTALQEQIQRVVEHSHSKKAESILSHPLLLKRIDRILAH